MRCVTIDAGGAVIDVDPQPIDTSTCLVVLATPGELGGFLPALSVEDALQLSGAIIGLWVFAWVWRFLRK